MDHSRQARPIQRIGRAPQCQKKMPNGFDFTESYLVNSVGWAIPESFVYLTAFPFHRIPESWLMLVDEKKRVKAKR